MIASDQERDALMAAVERYGNARVFSQDAAQHFFRIRAMLAPPDAGIIDALDRVQDIVSELAEDDRWDGHSDRELVHNAIETMRLFVKYMRGETRTR